jgi:hypothetical protein
MLEDLDLVEDIRFGQPRKVDRERGLIEDVKLLGLKSSNGNDYSPEAVKKASGMYEGVAVYLNHQPQKERGEPRRIADRFGKIEKVRFVEGDGIRGNLRFNPFHPLAGQISWSAEHMPDAAGMSHVAKGRGSRTGAGRFLVEELVSVASVDLVADGATVKSLFESAVPVDTSVGTKGKSTMELKDLTLVQLREQRGDLVEAILADTKEKSRIRELEESNKALQAKVDAFEVAAKLAVTRAAREKLLAEAKLPDAVVTDTFKKLLIEAADETAAKELIEDRRKIAAATSKPSKPVSREQHLTEGAADTAAPAATVKEFVATIRRR